MNASGAMFTSQYNAQGINMMPMMGFQQQMPMMQGHPQMQMLVRD